MSLRVGLVASAGTEGDAALAWLGTVAGLEARRHEPGQVEAAVNESDVLWVHGESRQDGLPTEAVRGFVAQGGGLLLTLRAASLVGPLGIETVPPNDCREMVWSHRGDEWWSDQRPTPPAGPHVRGLEAYGPHVLLEGLHNGTYCWAPSEGEPFAWACYSGGAWPADGRVVAVERGYRVQNPERVVAWEYAVGRGCVLCLGAFVSFAAPERRLRPQLEQLVLNALRAAASPAREPRTWWPSPGSVASASEALLLPEPLEFDGALPVPSEDGLMMAGAVRHEEAFDLAGRRALLVGDERRGIRELWFHPHRAVASWIVRADGDLALGTRAEVTPDVVSRVIQTGDRRLLESAFVALEHPVALLAYRPGRKRRESVGRGPLDFEIELVADLRRTWPFAAGCGGNLVYHSRGDGRVTVVASESDDGVAAVFVSRAASVQMERAAGGALAVRCRIRTTLGSPLLVAVVGGASQGDFQRTLRAVRRLGVAGLVRQRVQRAAVLTEARLAVRSDDDPLDRGFAWAKRRLDAFLGDVPGVGRSLLAGYGAAPRPRGDGRAGETRFVGPDACWAGFALLAEGEYSVVRQTIRFLGDRQDVTGKVLQDATTSGQFHFDGADATPLYLLLVARYLAWSGDRDFVASIWPHVERAAAYCLSTDRDGDGLIEHSDGGGGGGTGPEGGRRVSLYLAGLWQAALRGLARAGELLGRDRFAAECWARAARVTAAIEDRFYDAGRGCYARELRADGATSWTQCAVLAVPVLLGAANPVRARSFLDALGGDAFSAQWGVRMLPVTDPRFSPADREAGAVRPLVTGWAALAEYRAGLGESAFRHLRANAVLAYGRQRGAFDETLDGLEERAAGGCADRAASAGMVVLPLVEGLLGVEPDGGAGRLTVAPQLPQDWARLDVLGLRCADSAYDLALRRRDGALVVALRRTLGPGLDVTLAPWLPALPEAVTVDGHDARPAITAWGAGVRCALTLEAAAEHEVRYLLQ